MSLLSFLPVPFRSVSIALVCTLFVATLYPLHSIADETFIDLNSADQNTLESLPKIGPSKAKAIIAFRTQNGPFASAKDIVRVRGIGEGTFRVFCHRIAVKGEPGCSKNFAKGQDQGEGPLNINTATLDELDVLPGIGPARAQQIIDQRPYTSLDQLLEIRGIGIKTLDKMRPFIHVGPTPTSSTQGASKPSPTPPSPSNSKTNDLRLNTMSAQALAQSGAVPIDVAENIVRLREQRGGFVSVEELSKVLGVTPEMMRRLRGVVRE